MPSLRDNRLRLLDHFSYKLDRRPRRRGVITDVQGNQSGTGSVWANEATRMVWMMPEGATIPGQIRCVQIPNPQIGLGVEWGYLEGAVEPEVLGDDQFLRYSPVGNQDWVSTSAEDLGPGGRLQLWLDTRLIFPLSTFPDDTGLTVNAVAGDYPYNGARVTFTGQTGIALTQNPNAGEHYYAGLYLDGAGTLQVIYGSSVSTSLTPPEPSWPAGAFLLSVVRVNDTQTRIVFAPVTNSTNDIFDRRMAWSDENFFHNLLSVTHSDTLTGSVVAGDIIIGNATPKWARLAKGTDGQVLTLVSGLPDWEDATGGSGMDLIEMRTFN